MTASARQLPRGRHRLTREEVLRSQRGRILAAIGAVVAEEGFPSTTVAKVIARAGVSRETFYEQFSDKEDCFLEALAAGAEGLVEILGEALAQPASDPAERLAHVLEAYLGALASAPAFAKAYLIDAYGAGPRSTRRRIEQQQRFVDFVAAIVGADTAEDRFTCEALVAAISSMATARVGTGRVEALPELQEPLMTLVRKLLPEGGR